MGFAIKRVAKWIGAIMLLSFVMFAGLVLYLLGTRFVLPWDYSYSLQSKVDTIEVYYIAWACDCSDWRVIGEEFPDDELEKHTIFIESRLDGEKYTEAKLTEDCWPSKLKLVGKFYEDEGISRDYEIEFEKPESARVFYYESYEVLDSSCAANIVDFS